MPPPRFSKRLEWSIARNAWTLAADQRRIGGLPLLDLTQSNPTEAGIAYPPIQDALADERMLRYEPMARGLLIAREAVGEYYRGEVSADDLLLTASTSEAYSYLFKLLCDPGDEVLAPRPSYPLFEMLGRLESVNVRQYSLRYDHGWFIDIHALRNRVTKRTRAIVWVNPNNPTGSFIKDSEYAAIAEMCNEYGLALICDEVFADYSIRPGTGSLPSLTTRRDCLCFTLSGLSKVCGLPQMKLGWIAVGGPASAEALERLEWIADTFLSVGAPVQYAAPRLLQARHTLQQTIMERVRANLNLLRLLLQDSPCELLQVEAGWYATIKVPSTHSEEEWTLELLRRGVLVQPGYFFDFESEAYLIVSLLTEPAIFKEGVAHILNAC